METMSLEQQLMEAQASLCAEMGQPHPLFVESWYWEPDAYGYWCRQFLDSERGEKYYISAHVDRELNSGSCESVAGLWRWDIRIVPELPYERILNEETLVEGCSYGARQGMLAIEETLQRLFAAGLQLS